MKYINLINWTEQGIKAVKESPARLDKVRDMAQGLGVKVEQGFLTMGDTDMICIVDAPNDEAYATFALKLGATGSVRTRSVKCFPEAEYRRFSRRPLKAYGRYPPDRPVLIPRVDVRNCIPSRARIYRPYRMYSWAARSFTRRRRGAADVLRQGARSGTGPSGPRGATIRKRRERRAKNQWARESRAPWQ